MSNHLVSSDTCPPPNTMIRRHIAVAAALMSALYLLNGCSDLRQRRQRNIRFIQATWSHSNLLDRALAADILPMIESAKPESFLRPRIAAAILVEMPSGSDVLTVAWLETFSSIDGVEIGVNDAVPLRELKIPEWELKWNRLDAKSGVVFLATYQ